jgi:hypothetical protein
MTTAPSPPKTGRVLLVILLAQFIIVVDSTFMNVSISTLVADFDTTVTGILCVYSVGTTVTALCPTLGVFIFGWSVLEGLGSAMMLPAMMSLIVSNFAAGPACSPRLRGFRRHRRHRRHLGRHPHPHRTPRPGKRR